MPTDEHKKPNIEIWVRLAVSLGLMLTAVLIWGYPRETKPKREWFADVASGIAVLGSAGVWVSYFLETRAARALQEDISSRFKILAVSLGTGIRTIYWIQETHSNVRQNDNFREDLRSQLKRGRGEVRILAISAREFLHEGQGFAYDDIASLARRRKVRILLLHPWCEAAVSRGLHEDLEHSTFHRYRQSCLYQEIVRSCSTLARWKSDLNLKIEARLYKTSPQCFLVFLNDTVFVEHYNFGPGGRASGKVPMFQVGQGGTFYEQLRGHFESVWRTAERYEITQELVESLANPNPAEWARFEDSLKCSRPDLVQ